MDQEKLMLFVIAVDVLALRLRNAKMFYKSLIWYVQTMFHKWIKINVLLVENVLKIVQLMH